MSIREAYGSMVGKGMSRVFSIHPLTPDLVAQFARFSFKWQRPTLRETCVQGSTVALAASLQGRPVGLVVGRRRLPFPLGVIDSIYVASSVRNRGFGTRLLAAAEEGLVQKGCTALEIVYRKDGDGTPALERVLENRRWSRSEQHSVIDKYELKQAPGWVQRLSFRGADKALPWKSLSKEQLEEVRRGEDVWYPASVSPFQNHLADADPDFSFWFESRGQIQGWIVCVRLAEDTASVERFFVAEELQNTGRAVPLLAEAIKAMLKNGVRFASSKISSNPEYANPALLRFYRKHLQPLSIISVEYLQAVKHLEKWG
jgi:GNAT superfamily N-acetyltransferase